MLDLTWDRTTSWSLIQGTTEEWTNKLVFVVKIKDVESPGWLQLALTERKLVDNVKENQVNMNSIFLVPVF